jgi:hypothetical protein
MKINDNTEIGKILIDSPEYLLNLIKSTLDDHNFNKKVRSRKTLVRMGKRILPQMHKLIKSENMQLRLEASKIIELIADRTSIPVLIDLLDDTEFDIRWIAAVGLIKIGRRSVRPLLTAVRDGKSSILFNEGAHHVLLSLLNDNEQEKEVKLLLSLENYHTLGATAPVEASLVLGPSTSSK